MPATLPTTNPDMALYGPQIAADLAAFLSQGHVLTFPFTFAMADGAVLYTVPAGQRIIVTDGLWEVTTPFTGGTSSAIGLSSNNAAYNTKGDLMGGATGDVTATLGTVGYKRTPGAKLASPNIVVLVGGNTIRFDRITSAFTAGAGLIHVRTVPLPST